MDLRGWDFVNGSGKRIVVSLNDASKASAAAGGIKFNPFCQIKSINNNIRETN